jgi:hypothetical protein
MSKAGYKSYINKGVRQMTKQETLSAIAADMRACELALFFVKGHARRRFVKHLKACRAEIKRLNPVSAEVQAMTDEELLAELFA